MSSNIKTKKVLNTLTVDSATSGNITLSSTTTNMWKLDETVVLTANRTITLDTITAKDDDEIGIVLINIDFLTFKITILDSGSLMPTLTIDTPTTCLFKYKTNKWNQIS